MFGEILHGLAGAVVGARLRQRELHIRRAKERTRPGSGFRGLRIETSRASMTP